jgi:hypothetical protein
MGNAQEDQVIKSCCPEARIVANLGEALVYADLIA